MRKPKLILSLILVVPILTSPLLALNGLNLLSGTSLPKQTISGSFPVQAASANAGKVGRMLVIVNSSLYKNITDVIDQYKTDAEIMGYTVEVTNWTAGMGNATALRNFLISNHTTHANFKGALLVGDLPYACYYLPPATIGGSVYPYHDYFPCDLYLMDLDGSWLDNDFDGYFDDHQPLHLRSPEIWVGRVNPMVLTGRNATNDTMNYFNRLHQYKTGQVSRTHRSMVYIDDQWALWGDEWKGDLQLAYGDVTMVNATALTTDFDYEMNRLTQDYEFMWTIAHSNYTEHGWGPTYGAEGFTMAGEIPLIDCQPFFYNLYCCYACRFNESDFIGGQYLFHNHTLGIFGSTKTGGLNWGTPMYTDMGNNWTFGDAFVDWFTNSPRGVQDLYASYGIVYLGDPLLTTHYDVTVFPPGTTSATHPDSAITVSRNNASFSWTPADDLSGIVGYYFRLDQSSSSIPGPTNSTWATNSSATLALDKNGTWYFHIVAKDGNGVLSAPEHYTLQAEVYFPGSSEDGGTDEGGTDDGGDDTGNGGGSDIPGYPLFFLVGLTSLISCALLLKTKKVAKSRCANL